jgi:hypothetical protein
MLCGMEFFLNLVNPNSKNHHHQIGWWLFLRLFPEKYGYLS